MGSGVLIVALPRRRRLVARIPRGRGRQSTTALGHSQEVGRSDPAQATFYDRWFDSAWGHYAFEVERAALERAVGPLEGCRVLEVGCGTGRFTAAVEQHAGSVIGVDLDPAMLAIAARRVRAPLLVADAQHLPFDDATFDVTMAVTLCEFVTDPHLVVGELGRVTRPGGRIAIGALNARSAWGMARRRRLRRPPWQAAHFVTRQELVSFGRPLGRVTLHAALFAPGDLPGLDKVGPLLEGLERACPRFGAFQVLVVDKTGS